MTYAHKLYSYRFSVLMNASFPPGSFVCMIALLNYTYLSCALVLCIIRYHSIITSFYMRVHMWQHDKYLNNPITWLHGPHFLVAWNIHVSCNLSCATHGIVTCGIITCGTGHARDSHEWNTCRHKCAINNQQLTSKNMSNLLHNCESCSCMNYQGNGLIAHV